MSKQEMKRRQNFDRFVDMFNAGMTIFRFYTDARPEKPTPQLVEHQFLGAVLMIDEYGHLAEEEPTIDDIRDACQKKGFDPNRDREALIGYSALVTETIEFYGRLFEEGYEDALNDPELADVISNVAHAKYALVKHREGEI